MTKFEQKRAFQAFTKKYQAQGQRITNHQSGWVAEFGAIDQNSVDTIRKQNDSDVDHTWDGTVNREGGDSDPAWKGDLANAITHIQRAVESATQGADVNTVDGLNLLASTAQKLVELPEGVSIRKATVNKSGVTAPTQHYPDNDLANRPGATRTTISADELSNLPESAKRLLNTQRQEAFPSNNMQKLNDSRTVTELDKLTIGAEQLLSKSGKKLSSRICSILRL